jgi:hypothetical protein
LLVFGLEIVVIVSRYLVSVELEGFAGTRQDADAFLLAFINFVIKKPQLGRDGKEILRMEERNQKIRDWRWGIGDGGWKKFRTSHWLSEGFGFVAGWAGGLPEGWFRTGWKVNFSEG